MMWDPKTTSSNDVLKTTLPSDDVLFCGLHWILEEPRIYIHLLLRSCLHARLSRLLMGWNLLWLQKTMRIICVEINTVFIVLWLPMTMEVRYVEKPQCWTLSNWFCNWRWKNSLLLILYFPTGQCQCLRSCYRCIPNVGSYVLLTAVTVWSALCYTIFKVRFKSLLMALPTHPSPSQRHEWNCNTTVYFYAIFFPSYVRAASSD